MKTGAKIVKGKLIFLGTGDTEGIPSLFCSCSVCADGKRQRLRSSVLIEWQEKRFVIDISPDFRQQILRAQVNHIDGIFLTHPHYDHIGGLDDLRSWYLERRSSLPVVVSKETYSKLGEIRSHLVTIPQHDQSLSAAMALDFQVLEKDYGYGHLEGLPYTYVSYYQKACKVTGFCFGNLAYLTDMSEYSDEIFDYLVGIDTLIISVGPERLPDVFQGRKPSHLHLRQIEELVIRAGIKSCILTHISHHMQKELLLMPQVVCAYDGMVVPWTLTS